ncbi:MAG: GNAT family N-acetyltransferase [Firmicutes bacterium]|nr:GNAT family N-acetyltransferase [Bacillota bacterium]
MNPAYTYRVIPIDETFRPAVQAMVDQSWAGPLIAVNGTLWDTRTMAGFAAEQDDYTMIGYILYVFHTDTCEIMALESLRENVGVGTRLIERVKAEAIRRGKKKIAVTTTNDNLHALRFYQRFGFTLQTLRPNMLETSRKLKPGIPPEGIDGIPLRDEIELELAL